MLWIIKGASCVHNFAFYAHVQTFKIKPEHDALWEDIFSESLQRLYRSLLSSPGAFSIFGWVAVNDSVLSLINSVICLLLFDV